MLLCITYDKADRDQVIKFNNGITPLTSLRLFFIIFLYSGINVFHFINLSMINLHQIHLMVHISINLFLIIIIRPHDEANCLQYHHNF